MNDKTIPAASRGRIADDLRRARRRVAARLRAYRHELIVLALLATVALILMLPLIYHGIPSGHVGVLWKRFGPGTLTDETITEGSRLTFPWDRLFIYDTRVQMVERQVDVLSSDGLKITLVLVWRYRLMPDSAGLMHKYIGPNYAETLLAPMVSARARDVIAVYQPDEVYTDRRLKIQSQILEAVVYDLKEKLSVSGRKTDWLTVEDVLIKDMILPVGVQEAIVRKNAMFHEMEEYSYRVQREQKEAERKRIEAVGIRNFQEIVSNGMSDSYLRWRGIEATVDLAKSQNAKTVVIGNSSNGLPLILNMDGKDAGQETAGGAAARAAKAESRAAAKTGTVDTPKTRTTGD